MTPRPSSSGAGSALREGRAAGAAADLGRALQVRPDHPNAARRLAEAYQSAGDPLRAPRDSRPSAEPFSRRPRGPGRSGATGPEHGPAGTGFRRLRQAPRHRPGRPPPPVSSGAAILRLGRHRGALADLEHLAALQPADVFPYDFALTALRADVREALGDRQGAEADRTEARSLIPNDPPYLKRQAWYLVNGPLWRRDTGLAVTIARHAEGLAPTDSTRVNVLGVILYRDGRLSEAASNIGRRVARGERRHDAYDLFFPAMYAAPPRAVQAEARIKASRGRRWVAMYPNPRQSTRRNWRLSPSRPRRFSPGPWPSCPTTPSPLETRRAAVPCRRTRRGRGVDRERLALRTQLDRRPRVEAAQRARSGDAATSLSVLLAATLGVLGVVGIRYRSLRDRLNAFALRRAPTAETAED